MGVISLGEVPKNIRFGPIPTTLMIADPAYLIGNMTSDVLPEIPDMRVSLLHSMDRNKLEDWVPYLRSARNENEKNLDLYREEDGDLFYETSRNILPGEEVFIWFSRTYCQQIGVSLIDLDSHNDDPLKSTVYTCPQCSMTFKHNYVLICHKLFKCSAIKSLSKFDSSPQNLIQKENRKRKFSTPESFGPSHKFSMSWINNESPFTVSEISNHLSVNPSRVNKLVTTPPSNPLDTDYEFPNILIDKNFNSSCNQFPDDSDDDIPIKSSLEGQIQTFQTSKTVNPMVENLLKSALNYDTFTSLETAHFSSRDYNGVPLNVAQNWCAKCCTTFRMTSDLVYHMRTYHKNDALQFIEKKKGSEKPKKYDKLCCNICGESFRERHHLTRHMISHE